MKMKHVSKAGFTLVEILVTTAIIAILMGIVFGVSGLASKKADEGKVRAEMQKIGNAIEQYRTVYGSVPPDLETLTNSATQIDGEFKQFKTMDPWGQKFTYTNLSRYAYRLYSLGPKKTDASDDIESGSF